jgi:hypothetical protein
MMRASPLFMAAFCLAACLALPAQAQRSRFSYSAGERTAARSAPPAIASAAGSSWENYQSLLRNNPFLRDRYSARMGGSQGGSAYFDPEASLVLTGIAREGEEYVAFFENMQTRATEKVRTGQQIGLGRLGPMTLEYAEYQKDGMATRVEVGMNLRAQSNSPAPGVAEGAAVAPPGAPPDAVPAVSAPAGSDEAIIEMLRQKRLKEMGR